MSEFATIPVVKITLESMRQTIAYAFTKHLAEIDADIQGALADAVRSFDIRAIVRNEAERALRDMVIEAIRHPDVRSSLRRTLGVVLSSAAPDDV